jgi:anti-sigma regulatory factor (Ser/Thr protein kinase)/N-acetylglutamate synthase-like GNAT family acetyltransferase
MELKNTISFRLPARSELFPVLKAAAREFAALSGFSEPDVQRICLALEESVLYTLELGYNAPGETMSVDVSQTMLGIQISLRARGLPLEEEQLPRYDPSHLHTNGDTAGLSPYLIRNLVDTARFVVLDNGEREITLRKNLPCACNRKDSAAPIPAKDRSDTPFVIRRAGPDDAEGISRLALRSHGEVLFNEQIYYPARVREMLQAQEMVSIVAITPDGEVIGHGALVVAVPGAKSEELTFALVDERFRGRGCIESIAVELVANAQTRGAHVISALAVTNHVYSQRSVLQLGLRECSLLLAASPPSQAWHSDESGRPARISNLALCRYFKSRSDAPLYAPKRHRPMLERICAHLGITEHFAEPGGRNLPKNLSHIESSSNFKEGWGTMVVQDYGRDILPQIRAQLDLFRNQNLSIVFLLLPLASPSTAALTDALEHMGFFFSGLGPGDNGEKHLALQYLNGVDPAWDGIRVQTEFGRELVEYVRACALGVANPKSCC